MLPCAASDVQAHRDRDILPPELAYSKKMVVIAWILWGALWAFLYFMPHYVPYVNKHFATATCATPTWELMRSQNISCMNGADLTKLARAAGRLNWKGEPVACGCGQGVFGEDICPLGFLGQINSQGYTVSNYIGTAPGAAAFVLFMTGPSAMAWVYGTGDTSTLRSIGLVEHWLVFFAKVTLFLYQVFISAFFMLPGCIFFVAHSVTSACAVQAGVMHFVIVALAGWCRGQKGQAAIVGICLLLAMIHAARFVWASLTFTMCNVQPGLNQKVAYTLLKPLKYVSLSPACSEVLANPYATFYPEMWAFLMILIMPPALLTYKVFVLKES